MRSLAEFQLYDSSLDHILLFWRSLNERRIVWTGDYSNTRDYLSWLLSRINASSYEQAISSKLTTLQVSGSALPLGLGNNWIGLMRPHVLGAAIDPSSPGEPPFVICFEAEGSRSLPDFPVACRSRQDARFLVRRLSSEQNIDQRRWRQYECEFLLTPIEKLLLDVRRASGVTTFRTELERLLLAEMHQQPARAVA